MARVRLRHLHLPSSPTEGRYPAYQTAAAIQELLRRRLLDYKDSASSPTRHGSPPHPTLISFTPQPTYTLGRRQAQAAPSSLPPSEIDRLKAPLHVRQGQDEHVFHPFVFASPRGGLATYHGPGQVVLWPVMIINSTTPLGYKPFTVRCYSRLLENTTIALLRRLFGLEGFTTEDPGVWVGGDGEARKISALGIHLRRHVSSLGAAINLDMPITNAATTSPDNRNAAVAPTTHQNTKKCDAAAADDDKSNPWSRFVACGLAGKGVTCAQAELLAAGGAGVPGMEPEVVARAWAEELVKRMELEPRDVERVGRDEADELVWAAKKEGHWDAVGRDEL